MQRQNYNYSGADKDKIDRVDAHAYMNISGAASITVNSIGPNAVINISGAGKLKVKGDVGENVKFNITGAGKVKLSQEPPQSVKDMVQTSGAGSLKAPGYKSKKPAEDSNSVFIDGMVVGGGRSFISSGGTSTIIQSMGGGSRGRSVMQMNGMKIISENGTVQVTDGGVTTTYRGNNASLINNRLVIDNRPVTDNDPRISNIEVADKAPAARAPVRAARSPELPRARAPEPAKQQKLASDEPKPRAPHQPPSPKANAVDDIDDHVKSYEASIKSQPLNSVRFGAIKSEKIKSDYEDENRDHFDSVTLDIIDVPVTAVSGKIYNLDTLRSQSADANGYRKEPESQRPYRLTDIRPMPIARDAIKKDLTKLEKPAKKEMASPSSQGKFAHADPGHHDNAHGDKNDRDDKKEKKF